MSEEEQSERAARSLRVGSLFSGIGGLDHGLARAGFQHAFLCESDPWRRDVLRARFPGVPVYDDVRDVAPQGTRDGARGAAESSRGAQRERVASQPLGLLCGGFPCQDVSVAGQRRGLAGNRSGLFYEFARITESLRPGWLLVENVPGLLSSNGGRDFGSVLGTLADLGYGLAWRVLDSRFFGVPQRRRRVFIVGTCVDGDPRACAERAGEVLAVGARCDRHLATRGEAREAVAVASLSGLGTSGPDDNDGQGGRLVAESLRSHPRPGSNTSGTLVSRYGKGTDSDATDTLIAAPLSHGSNPNSNAAGRRREDDENLVAYTFDRQMGGSWTEGGQPSRSWIQDTPGRTRSLSTTKTLAVHEGASVRRLMPVECERLQNLPDGWTDLGGSPDSRRYAALGDAVTSSVAEWIGRRLA